MARRKTKAGRKIMPLNIEAPDELLHYLRSTGRVGPADAPRMTALHGGVSNRTVLVEHEDGSAWVLKQALPRLRVEVEWFSDLARTQREAAGLRWLSRMMPGAVPDYVFEDPAEHLLAMSAVPQPHVNWKEHLLAGGLEQGHVAEFARLLARIHRLGNDHIEEVATTFANRNSLESLRLEPYYLYTASVVAPAAPFLKALTAETRALRIGLTHGDYSPKNVLLHRDRLILLDHEVMHFGDPSLDVGFALSHLLSKAHFVAAQRGEFAAAALLFWREYRRDNQTSADERLETRAARHTLACVLARAAGRSPLEYMNLDQRRHQVDAVLPLILDPPATPEELVPRFCERL